MSAAATAFVDPAKISSANRVFEQLYYMVWGCLEDPELPTEMTNGLSAFWDTVKITSLDDIKDREDLKCAYFRCVYRSKKKDVVFYPFRPSEGVEVETFYETLAQWAVVLKCLKKCVKFLEDFDFKDSLEICKADFELLAH